MQLSLSEEQARELKQALDLHVDRMSTELVHTDDRAYREGLKHSLDLLEEVRRQLDAPLQASPETYLSS